ncbi:UNVERIFIED_ORG: hypothetical protein J2806_002554 [Kosakonia oryzae]|nr:hypothetical protein [Kosakonia oryzae]
MPPLDAGIGVVHASRAWPGNADTNPTLSL